MHSFSSVNTHVSLWNLNCVNDQFNIVDVSICDVICFACITSCTSFLRLNSERPRRDTPSIADLAQMLHVQHKKLCLSGEAEGPGPSGPKPGKDHDGEFTRCFCNNVVAAWGGWTPPPLSRFCHWILCLRVSEQFGKCMHYYCEACISGF